MVCEILETNENELIGLRFVNLKTVSVLIGSLDGNP